MIEDEDLLLAVLNSAPRVGGERVESLQGDAGQRLSANFAGTGSTAELECLRETRDVLHAVLRQHSGAAGRLQALLTDVVLVPSVMPRGLRWEIGAHADARLPARVVLAWSRVEEALPGRLRPCVNDECELFLIDYSRPGTARWCSMATCGNRMKARSHAARAREQAPHQGGRPLA